MENKLSAQNLGLSIYKRVLFSDSQKDVSKISIGGFAGKRPHFLALSPTVAINQIKQTLQY